MGFAIPKLPAQTLFVQYYSDCPVGNTSQARGSQRIRIGPMVGNFSILADYCWRCHHYFPVQELTEVERDWIEEINRLEKIQYRRVKEESWDTSGSCLTLGAGS